MWYLDAFGNPVDTGAKTKPGKNEVIDVGGVPYMKITSPGGEVDMYPLSEGATDYRQDMLAGEAGASERGKRIAQTDADFTDFADSGQIEELEGQIESTRSLLDEIRGGGFQNTGPLEGIWSQFWGDPETARLRAKSILRTLQNLQITNLAPVTEKELALVQDMYANIDRDPEQNIAILQDALEMLERKMEIVNRKGRYFYDKGTLRGFGTSRFAPEEAKPGDKYLP
jgi:hypothetical protein